MKVDNQVKAEGKRVALNIYGLESILKAQNEHMDCMKQLETVHKGPFILFPISKPT